MFFQTNLLWSLWYPTISIQSWTPQFFFLELMQKTGNMNETLTKDKESQQKELDTCTQLIADAFDKWVKLIRFSASKPSKSGQIVQSLNGLPYKQKVDSLP